MMKEINLVIKKDFDTLSGRKLGKSVYEKSNLADITFDDKALLIFPDTIVKVSASFVQGLLDEIFIIKGKEKTRQDIQVKMKTRDLEKSFFEKIY